MRQDLRHKKFLPAYSGRNKNPSLKSFRSSFVLSSAPVTSSALQFNWLLQFHIFADDLMIKRPLTTVWN